MERGNRGNIQEEGKVEEERGEERRVEEERGGRECTYFVNDDASSIMTGHSGSFIVRNRCSTCGSRVSHGAGTLKCEIS